MDARLSWSIAAADLSFNGLDIEMDEGLETAIIISLATDRRAEADDELPGAASDRRGWWGDAYADEGDRIGSRLWLLSREKKVASVLQRAKEYAEEALLWMLDDGVAKSIVVTAEAQAPDRLALLVEVIRPTGKKFQYLFNTLWEAR